MLPEIANHGKCHSVVVIWTEHMAGTHQNAIFVGQKEENINKYLWFDLKSLPSSTLPKMNHLFNKPFVL